MTHRYELEKYKGIRSRYECPACHRKRVFARYVDTWTGKYLSPDVGRCNREDNCGYHYTPKEYFHDHPEKKEYKVSTRVKIVYNKLNTIRNNAKVALRVKQLQPQRIGFRLFPAGIIQRTGNRPDYPTADRRILPGLYGHRSGYLLANRRTKTCEDGQSNAVQSSDRKTVEKRL